MEFHSITHEVSEARHRYLSVRPQSMSGPGHTSLQLQLTEHAKTFAGPSKSTVKKKPKKRKKERYLQSFMRYT